MMWQMQSLRCGMWEVRRYQRIEHVGLTCCTWFDRIWGLQSLICRMWRRAATIGQARQQIRDSQMLHVG